MGGFVYEKFNGISAAVKIFPLAVAACREKHKTLGLRVSLDIKPVSGLSHRFQYVSQMSWNRLQWFITTNDGSEPTRDKLFSSDAQRFALSAS
jgi:hypothetical protein